MYLNSWSDDWDKSYAARITTETPTIDEIKAAVREFITKNNDRWPDVWVLTHYEMQELKLHCERRDPTLACCGTPNDPWSIYGIRIEECATKLEVHARVAELASQGVKAGFLESEDDK